MFFIVPKVRRPSLLSISYGPFTSTEGALDSARRLLAAGDYEIVGPADHHSDVIVAERTARVS